MTVGKDWFEQKAVGLARSRQCGWERVVVVVVGWSIAYFGNFVPGSVAVAAQTDFARSCSFVVAAVAVYLAADAVLEMPVVRKGCRSSMVKK